MVPWRAAMMAIGLVFSAWSYGQLREAAWAPVNPGTARLSRTNGALTLRNRALTATFTGGGLVVKNLYTGQALSFGSAFFAVNSPDKSVGGPISGSTSSSTGMNSVSVIIDHGGRGMSWRETYSLRDGEHFLRYTINLRTKQPLNVERITAFTGFGGGKVAGSCPGSPVVAGSIFAGLAHPMSVSKVQGGHFTCEIERKTPLQGSVSYEAVIGVAPAGQMRRAVAAYVEDTRPRPYAPFLHYNSWYDIGYFTPYTETDALDRINTFGRELSQKRGVKLSSFLFDDGWDDTSTVWEFSKAFPNGFLPLKAAAAKYGAGPGVWLSPWGGYGGPRNRRLAAGRAAGMEIDSQGYALSGPKYYDRFHEVTTAFVTKQGINQFKLDGTGSPDKHTAGSAFDSDFSAAIALIEDLRKASGGKLFINLTTGTWPSPFWSKFADSIWRGGEDHSFAGVGTKREQWMTYRDGDTYRGVVETGPLYPINSLMLHGLIYAQHAQNLGNDPGDDFAKDVWAYFSTGTQLEEMYVTPSLLTPANWDELARAAKWVAANAKVMQDVHWIGGDPLKLEVYGHAAWSPGKTIVALRNPSDHAQAFSLDLAKAAELPARLAKQSFTVRAIFGGPAAPSLKADTPTLIALAPFQVLVLELTPKPR
jgi:hypothetical protein